MLARWLSEVTIRAWRSPEVLAGVTSRLYCLRIGTVFPRTQGMQPELCASKTYWILRRLSTRFSRLDVVLVCRIGFSFRHATKLLWHFHFTGRGWLSSFALRLLNGRAPVRCGTRIILTDLPKSSEFRLP